ncbi:MAG: helix-turn-helix transcriptional regulator [Prevotella sp.]|jgi:predicted DNA-binding transcriptional regulator YafY
MSLQSPSRVIHLITRLSSPSGASLEELMRFLETTRRSVFYYLALLRDNGFTIIRRGDRYYIDPDSEFLQRLVSNVSFSESEAVYLYRLASAADRTALSESVRRKLERFYDINIFSGQPLQERMARNVERLCYAIEHKRAALLKNYTSAHSRTVSNRLVEPFALSNDDTDVECYEITTHRNKTFKVARMEEVIVSDHLKWGHEVDHNRPYTDVFNFSGEARHHVVLRLGLLSYNLLHEEYPRAVACLRREDDSHWIFETDVTSYLGIGRFVLGLIHDITVLSDDGLRNYLRQRADEIREKCSSNA